MEEFIDSQMESENLAFVGDGDQLTLRCRRGRISGSRWAVSEQMRRWKLADAILMEDEPSRIIDAIRISRGTIRAVKQNLIFAIGMKTSSSETPAFFGYVSMQDAIIADMCVMLINILNSFWVITLC